MKPLDVVNEWIGRVFACLPMLIVGIILYDIVARAVFSSPLLWSFEVTTQLYAVFFMMLGGYTLLHQSHVNVEILTERLPGKIRCVIDIVCYCVFFFPFIAVLIIYGLRYARRSWGIGETTWGAAAIPVYPVKSMILIAGCLLLIQGLSEVIKLLRQLFVPSVSQSRAAHGQDAR
jgi:TRAP-type mannitol/chloroaromatic compound transport system permease small subunit